MSAMSGAERQKRYRQKQILMGKNKPYKNTWEEAFRKFAIEHGWETTKRGWPDFLCLSKDGEFFVVEVKPPGRRRPKLSGSQHACMDFLSALGARCYIFDGSKMVRYVTPSSLVGDGHSDVTKSSRHSSRHKKDNSLVVNENLPEKPIKRNRGSILESNWIPSLEERQYAIALGLDPDRTADDFRDYWIAKTGQGATKADWSATWRTWCRRAQSFGHTAPRQATNGHVNGHTNGLAIRTPSSKCSWPACSCSVRSKCQAVNGELHV